ncbi:hypothetical protein HN018_06835 [Lichenicola cladoniae]|uniref:DOD-type homing endonuclease domain-containing protein n=1 Tax=Lichenicola cladoniae TaxID=1484109 RepID=A0A6M8HNA7_9PROT|nr:terminase TerL endonuclease subunit [Lichenicola cladoniae]QKE89791.1 hypothetical protein HN018_06835 [Lichenicola cladoniae]
MGDLRAGDSVFGPDGSVRHVAATTAPMHDRPCYRLALADGESIVADAEHQWLTDARQDRDRLKGRGRKTAGAKPSIKTTREIALTLLCREERNHRLTLPAPFELPEVYLPIEPYTLGAWLGDGTTAAGIITIGQQDAASMEVILGEVGQVISKRHGCAYRLGTGVRSAERFRSVQARLRGLGVLGNKHIPQSYLRAGSRQRMALLQGLMDTDGYVSAAGQCEFTSTSKTLAQGVEELLWGLGFKPLVTEGVATLQGRVISAKWRIQFWATQERSVFRLPRKAARLKPKLVRATRSQTRQVSACEPVASVPVRCIQVDHPDGMFLVGRSFVPTHNSALSAPVGLYMMAADDEHGAEVYCGATTEKQAWEVFRPATLMARGRPDLLSHYGIKVNASNIHIAANSSRFEPVIGKPGDGASPSCAIVDEYHEHDTPELWDTMLTGMGAREQPMMWGITTAGDNIAGPCFDLVLTGRKVLEGTIENEELFYLEYSIDEDDEWTSPDALRKANPNMGVSVLEEFLLARQREAIRNPRQQAVFKTKHLNLWVNSRAAYFNMQSWFRCCQPDFDETAWYGRRAIIGLDLASKNDIAALQVLIPLDDGRYVTFGRYYLPREILEQTGKEHYYAWSCEDPALLILTEGNMIDFEQIEADIDELRKLFDVEELTFDPSQATMLTTRLMAKGVTVTQFDQNARNFSEPMKEVAGLLDAGRIIHGCSPKHPMSWMMSNVTARQDAKEQVYPRKEKPENKIDGPVALIMAMGRALLTGVRQESVYESRGLLVL